LSAATNTLNFAAGTLPAPGSGFLSDGFFAASAVPFSLALRATGGSVARILRALAFML
jgi:hypothetical protein